MDYNFMFFLGLLFLLLILSFLSRKCIRSTAKYPFQRWEKSDLPFITVNVQGNSLNMIADSAGAVSIIRKEVLNKISYEPNSRKINLAALTDDKIQSDVVSIPITINGKEIKTDFVVYDSDDIACFKKHGIVMDGLLGVEFFKASNGIIDFKSQAVKFL